MTRKGFMAAIASIASIVGASWLVKKPANDNERYPWSNAKHPDIPGNSFRDTYMRCRVTVDGEDVTNRCHFYDVNQRLVGLYKHREGRPYYDPETHGVAQEWRSGNVEVFVS